MLEITQRLTRTSVCRRASVLGTFVQQLELTGVGSGQCLDLDAAQLPAPPVDVFVGVQLQEEDGVGSQRKHTANWPRDATTGQDSMDVFHHRKTLSYVREL